MFHNNEDM